MLSPFYLLALVCALSGVGALVSRVMRQRRAQRVRQLAASWKMNYSPRDQLRLTEKIARAFPVPGAAHLLISDLIYGAAGAQYRYFFTAEFTTGVMHHKRRMARAAYFSEPRERTAESEPCDVVLAPQELSLIEQYRRLFPTEE